MENNKQEQLRQLQNTVEVVGTLKSKELKFATSAAGNNYVAGTITVVSKVGNRINEIPIKVFIMASSKLYKGIETVNTDYKTLDKDGDAADRVRITGELKLNEYYNSQGNLVQFNEVKGVFFNRLTAENDQPDRVVASIDTIIDSFVEKLDKDQLPTGDYSVNGFTVGWGNDVIELKNAIVKAELADAFMNLYQPGQTGRLTLKINNYVELEEKETAPTAAVTHGFGSTEKVEPGVIKNYVNNLEVIGGDMPYFGNKEYTPEEITKAKQIRELKLQTMNSPAPNTPPTANTGFGAGSTTTATKAPDTNDMPDF